MKATELQEQLEGLTDNHGLEAVLEALGETCELKAEHILTTYQDKALAAGWRTMGRRLTSSALLERAHDVSPAG